MEWCCERMTCLDILEKRPRQVRSREGRQSLLLSSSALSAAVPANDTTITTIVNMDGTGIEQGNL